MLIPRSRLFRTFLFAMMVSLTVEADAMAKRAIPDDNLAYPVLIILKNRSTGSEFYLNADKATYLITAKHVLYNPSTNKLLDKNVSLISYSADLSDPNRNFVALDLSVLEANGNIRVHTSEDVVALEIGRSADAPSPDTAGRQRLMSTLPGVTINEVTAHGIVGVAKESVRTFDQVLTGNEVIVFGYPTSLGLKEMPQLDPARPLLRKGLVAGQNPQKRSIVLDCPSYPGDSGGPVLQVEVEGFQTYFRIIGVVREFVPFADSWTSVRYQYSNTTILNSGYSIATPMDFVLELIK